MEKYEDTLKIVPLADLNYFINALASLRDSRQQREKYYEQKNENNKRD